MCRPGEVEPQRWGWKRSHVRRTGVRCNAHDIFAPRSSLTPTPTPTPVSSTPTPTPSEIMEELDLSEYSVSLLNGSGVPGEAGNAEELLSELEFADIKTGNAESYDYEQTEVSLKKNLPQGVYSKIEAALSETYSISLSETTLDEDSTFDIIIIVGQRK